MRPEVGPSCCSIVGIVACPKSKFCNIDKLCRVGMKGLRWDSVCVDRRPNHPSSDSLLSHLTECTISRVKHFDSIERFWAETATAMPGGADFEIADRAALGVRVHLSRTSQNEALMIFIRREFAVSYTICHFMPPSLVV